MPRKQFVEDLQAAKAAGTFPFLHGIKKGDDDESICFSFTLSQRTLDFQAAVSGKLECLPLKSNINVYHSLQTSLNIHIAIDT
jgi:hypothetical protein